MHRKYQSEAQCTKPFFRPSKAYQIRARLNLMILRSPFSTLSSAKCIIFVIMVKGEKIIISNYSNKTAKFNTDTTLTNELNHIKNGYLKVPIENCRLLLSQGFIEKYKEEKGNLPGVTYSGTFNGSHKAENLTSYSKLIIIDFDGLDSSQIQQQKTQIFNDKHVLAV